MQRAIVKIIFVLSVSTSTLWAYSGGTGEPNDPYQIATAEDLIALGNEPNDYNDCFILTADIDLDPNLPGIRVFDRAVIAPDANGGSYGFHGVKFSGVFDGRMHVIRHLHIEGASYLGLFGKVSSKAIVLNIRLEAVDVNGTGSHVGGLVGLNDGIITSSYSVGSIVGNYSVGGLVGVNGGVITSSYSAGSVSGVGSIGGLVGDNESGGGIISSYSTCSVSGDGTLGGLVGYNLSSITSCYSTGLVSGGKSVGGFIGTNRGGGVLFSFWDTMTSGQAESRGGIGLTTTEIQDVNTFLESGWDFMDETENGTCNYWLEQESGSPGLAVFYSAIATEPNGTGLQDDPYLITDVNDLGTVWIRPHASYRLDSDVDMAGIAWNVAVVPGFGGVFDGDGHVISNLNIKGAGYLGLMGVCFSSAIISNLGLEWIDVNGLDRFVGGIVGENSGGITSSYCTGSVSGTYIAGGLVGQNYGSITSSYSTSSVSGDRKVGGLVGRNSGNIISSYSASLVSGDDSVGGLVGGDSGNITSSFWDTEISRQVTHSWGGMGLTTEEMQGIETYLDAGWGFEGEIANSPNDVWFMPVGNYPGLRRFQGRYAIVPDVVGLTVSQAQDVLVGQGYFVVITYQLSDTIPDGQVIAQNSGPASEVLSGSVISLILSVEISGTGESDDPYQIDTVRDLIELCDDPSHCSKHFVLCADLDFSGYCFKQALIAPASSELSGGNFSIIGHPFSGSFNGNDHVIRNLSIQGKGYLGLFGFVDEAAVITHLGLEAVNVSGEGDCIGGLVGLNGGSITSSYSCGLVNGYDTLMVGGLVGWNYGSIVSCYSNGLVNGDYHWGNSCVGGLVGWNDSGSITSSYSSSLVSGDGFVGGLVGCDLFGNITSSFWDTEASGLLYSDGGTGMATAEMQDINTYLDAGWDFVDETVNGLNDIWFMPETDYPHLSWELGDPNE